MRKDDPAKRCGNCNHWHKTGPDQGVCVNEPPKLVQMQQLMPPSILKPNAPPEMVTQFSSMYPPVGAAGIPCSHWQAEP